MTPGQPVPLDPDDEPDDSAPPFPEIPPWQLADPYSGTRLALTFAEDTGPQLTLSCGDPNDGPYQVLRLDIDPDDLARLARDHIAPLTAWEQAERDRVADHVEQGQARERATADASAWVVQTGVQLPNRDYQIRVHRNGCSVVKRGSVGRRGEHTHGGTHDGQALLKVLDRVEHQLRELISEAHVRAKQHAASLRQAGRTRDTNPERRPLMLCLTCRPLGERSPALANKIHELAETTRVAPDQEVALAQLMGEMRQLVWEVEQAHLDTLRLS